MKKIILSIICIYSFPLIAQQIQNDYHQSSLLDINNIHIWFNNLGNTSSPPGTGWASGSWVKIPDDYYTILYDQGPWVIGKINNKVHLGFVQWYNYYSAGPIINNQPAIQIRPEDSLKYRIYKISRGDTELNPDYKDWPFDFGAPKNFEGKPKLFGDQTLWTVYNAMDTMTVYRKYSNRKFFNEINPFPIEIQQLVYAHAGNWWDDKDILSNTVFMEWTIINKGNEQIDSTYLGLWTDIDFNGADNPASIDSSLQLGLCRDGVHWENYNYHPAVGYTLLYGPIIPATGSVAIYKGRQRVNYKNLKLSSFHLVSDDANYGALYGIATNVNQAWNIARGFDLKGNIIINPITGKQTKFPFDGDPATKNGWYYDPPSGTGGGAGFHMFTGPFNLAPNDTQWVVMAFFPALGKDNMESIQLLRKKAKILHSLSYDKLAFSTDRIPIDSTEASVIPTDLRISDNFPNPFNSETKIKVELPKDDFVKIELYNSIGQYLGVVNNSFHEIGINYITVNFSKYASGVYFMKISTGILVEMKKLVLLK